MSSRMNSSRNGNRNNKAASSSVKPFCKVCFDSGKPETLYSSHCVRNPKYVNVVVCPTLLAQACLTCGKKGHTSSHCQATAAEVGAKNPDKKVVKMCCTVASVTPKNMWMLLGDDEQDIVAAPLLVTKTQPVTISYATMLKKNTAVVVEPVKITIAAAPSVRKPVTTKPKKVYTNWADAESSDEEEDDDNM